MSTLHQAIKNVILDFGPADVGEITSRINEQKLYVRGDGTPVPKNQVSARVRKYPHMFVKKDGVVDINKANEIVWLKAYIGGYFGTSFEVEIDLENKKATYKKIEQFYNIEKIRTFQLDDVVLKSFKAKIDSIRIIDWDRSYHAPALDGTSWTLHVKTLESIFASEGSNAFPKNWGKFCNCIEKIVGGGFR